MSTSTAPAPRNELSRLFESDESKLKVSQATPQGISSDRLRRMALMAIYKDAKLQKCSPVSLFTAFSDAASLGLAIGSATGEAYLVPYDRWDKQTRQVVGTDAQLIIGYRGLAKLAMQSGEVLIVEARCVYEHDAFRYRYGDGPQIQHTPGPRPAAGPRKLTHVYAIAKLKSGISTFEVLDRAEVDAIRERSRAKSNGPWVTDYDQMARKTVVRRLMKLLPLSAEMLHAVGEVEERHPEYIDGATGEVVDPLVAARRNAAAAGILPAEPAPPAAEEQPGPHADAPPVETPDEPPNLISEAQRRRLFAITSERGVSKPTLDEFLRSHGVDSTNRITVDFYEQVIDWARTRPA